MRHPSLLSALLAVPLLLHAAQAQACGGCFSPVNPDPKNTVVQSAERVLFVPSAEPGKSLVWIEVVYAGAAADFAWVLPLPKVPVVATGTRRVFDALDARLRFRVAQVEEPMENCRDPHVGCKAVSKTDAGDASTADMSAGTAADTWLGPIEVAGVTVLASGSTGPYEYSVIQGDKADLLYEWLTKNGYKTPPAAKPILQVHADKKDVFLAVKLQNGAGVQAIRPIALTMATAEPCVPLRLTSIAAADELAVTVTVAGSGRAIVKNHFDVAVNPLRLLLLGEGPTLPCGPEAPAGAQCRVPSNYDQVLAAAIDEAAGHAFVTEASVAGTALGQLSPVAELDTKPLEAGKTLYDLAVFLGLSGIDVDGELVEALAPQFSSVGPLFMTATGVEAVGALAACGKYWKSGGDDTCKTAKLTLKRTEVMKVTVNGKAAAEALHVGIIDPLFHVGELLAKAGRTTRLVMRISPSEMDRDPVFAFHPTLPTVAPLQTVQFRRVCADGWLNGPQKTRLNVAGLGSWLLADRAIIDPLFQPLPTSLAVVVQEEAGEPVAIGAGDRKLADAAIAGALPGAPSLPPSLVLQAAPAFHPPVSDPVLTTAGVWHAPGGCEPLPGWTDGQAAPGDVPLADAGHSEDAGDAADAPTDPLSDAGSGATGVGTAAPPKTASGCSSAPRSGGWPGWAACLLVGAALGYRRRTAPQIRALGESSGR